jgi:murein DD-endopeptidase MepM/ murein hydrolase activator NlpD
VVGRAGTTGRSTGVHLHFALQYFGHGLSGYVINDVVDPAPYLGL